MAAPTFRTTIIIISRGVSTVHLNPNPPPPQLSYTLITAPVASSPPACLSSDPAPPPRLEYRANGSLSWMLIEPGTPTKALVKRYNYLLAHTDKISVTEEQYMVVRSYSTSIDGITLSALPVQFRFVQLDHRGGFCDCWAVANLTVTPPNGQATELSYVSCS